MSEETQKALLYRRIQLVHVERIIELEKHHLATSSVIIYLDKDTN